MSENSTSDIYHGHLAKIVQAADAQDISAVNSLTNELLTLVVSNNKNIKSPSTTATDLPDSIIFNLQKIHCRSLIGLSKYDHVLKFCDSLTEKGSNLHYLLQERAYALYKLGRYAACRNIILQALASNQRSMNRDATRCLKHILAQCYFRLSETEKAVQLYSDLLEADVENVVQEEETYILTNAVAALSANNAVPISYPFPGKLQDAVVQIIEEDADSMALVEYPYEAVYNYATLLLQTSTSMRQTQRALKLLTTAEEKCLALCKEANHGKSVSDNLLSIQSNMALGKMQSGDMNGALRSYSELTSSVKKRNDSNEQSMTYGKISFVADCNIASIQYLRGSSLSAFDLLKKMPDPFMSTMVKEGIPLANAHQVRILMYNRAILHLQLGKLTEMKSTLENLKKLLAIDSGESKKKKKQNGGNSKGSSSGKCNPVPATKSEILSWRCRIALLEYEVSKDDEKLTELQNTIDVVLKDNNISNFEKEVLDYAKAEIQLYKIQKSVGDSSEMSDDVKQSLIAILEDLPGTMKYRPATVASLCSLFRSMDMIDKVEVCLNASSQTAILQKNLAAFKLRLGMYDHAATMYESILKNDSDLSHEDKIECQAGLVKSLSHINIEKTIELAKDFKFLDDDDDLSVDGEDLEVMEIPRLGKGSKGSVHLRHILTSRKQERKKSNNQSKDSILRRRARKRDAYLEKLQKEGKYNPDRPTKPDPERWIPKNQRSYNRRGRKGRSKFLGAQGGGTGFGAEKEAAKLDAYARAAAKAAGKDITGGKPSTAHLSVSSNNRRRR